MSNKKVVIVDEEDFKCMNNFYIRGTAGQNCTDYERKYSTQSIEGLDLNFVILHLKSVINANAKEKMAIIEAISILQAVKGAVDGK
jgi:hypothetical protein